MQQKPGPRQNFGRNGGKIRTRPSEHKQKRAITELPKVVSLKMNMRKQAFYDITTTHPTPNRNPPPLIHIQSTPTRPTTYHIIKGIEIIDLANCATLITNLY